jgi:Na+-driven multidrug efflux pump
MKRNNSMLEGNVLKSIILFALPIMASSMLQYNYSLVDNIIVGRYVSNSALAAVGSVGPINSFIIGAALGLTTGFSIPVAHAFGEKNSQKLSRYAGSSISLALIVGCIIMVVYITSSQIDIYPRTNIYYDVRFVFGLFNNGQIRNSRPFGRCFFNVFYYF